MKLAATHPYEPGSPESDYWQARNELAVAARRLNEKLVSTDIPPDLADELTEQIESLSSQLSELDQVAGLVEMGRRTGRGSAVN